MRKPLFLRKADRDDYLVIQDDEMVGTIHKVYAARPDPWRWRVDSQYAKDLSGWSVDLSAAKRDFRAAWDGRKIVVLRPTAHDG